MSNTSFQNPLNESERLAYLKAMDVTQWIPRHEIDDDAQSKLESQPERQAELQTAEQQAESSQPAEAQSAETRPEETEQSEASLPLSGEAANTEITATQTEPQTKPETEQTTLPTVEAKSEEPVSNHYLKVVPWQSGPQSNHGVFIVCRHEVDQPAQSFARASSPSQFMSDMIQAINAIAGESIDVQIRLAHLSQAGLGKDCQPFEQALADIQPKQLLVLGEETVKELFGEESSVASLRGQQIMLKDKYNCVISYHPFTLIKNPHLKSLALEDLKFLVSSLVKA